jgi:para-nitrobenzyl esterase
MNKNEPGASLRKRAGIARRSCQPAIEVKPMRAFTVVAVFLAAFTSVSVVAQTPPKTAAHAAYSTSDTDIGTLLDDPAARAIVDKHVPGFSSGDQIDMARGMTLKAIQQFAADTLTDKVLAEIDAELAKLSPKK